MNELPQAAKNDNKFARWVRRLHLVLTVGGGFAGLCTVLVGMIAAKAMPFATYWIFFLACFLYSFGVFVGLRYNERPDKWPSLLLFYLIQIPMFSSPLFSYLFTSGLSVQFGLGGGRVGLSFHLGSLWLFTLRTMQPWGVAVNLFAVAMVSLVIATHTTRLKRPASEIVRVPSKIEDPY